MLVTLFVLSYAKLFRIIIWFTIFSSTPIVYPSGYNKTVWLYDGSVEYLKREHVPLFIAALATDSQTSLHPVYKKSIMHSVAAEVISSKAIKLGW